MRRRGRPLRGSSFYHLRSNAAGRTVRDKYAPIERCGAPNQEGKDLLKRAALLDFRR